VSASATYTKSIIDISGTVTTADTGQLDAFGRLRVSQPATLFESSFEYDLRPFFIEPVVAGAGTVTHDANMRSAILSSGGVGSAFMQTRQYHPYEKGKSQLVKVTFVLGAAAAGVTRRVGYFDALNGAFFQQTPTSLDMVLRSSVSGGVVNTVVPQASWNVDPLDGTGPSGIALDVTKQQILVIDGQWLGAGRVRMALNIDGVTIIVHQFLNANTNAVAPYMQTFTLPVRWEISSTSTSATMQAICCDVESEGGDPTPTGTFFSARSTADTILAAVPATVPVIAIRPKATFNGFTNRKIIYPLDTSLLVGTNPAEILTYYNATITGGVWVSADPQSAVEFNVGGTIAGGVLVEVLYMTGSSGAVRSAGGEPIHSQYPIVLDSTGANPRVFAIAARSIGSASTARAAINWQEIG
jgi:hypothetical protein